MPKRIPVKSIVLNRDGKQIRPAIGKEFDFTTEELADIMANAPGHVRKVIVEDAAAAKQVKEQEAAAEQAAVAARANVGKGKPGTPETTAAVPGGRKAGAASAEGL